MKLLDLKLEITSWDNLINAFNKAKKGKQTREEVAKFSAYLYQELAAIQVELINETYSMGSYRKFLAYEPKRREISAAPFRDRVVQHAILNLTKEIWDKALIEDTFACREGKGTHKGAERIQRWLRDLSKSNQMKDLWVVKTDYSKYFATIPHDKLKTVLRKRISCAFTLRVLDEIIDSTVGDVGIPVGNLTSQWFANLYGNEVDQYVKRVLRVKRYLRYMDDTVAIFKTKEEALDYHHKFKHISSELGLTFSKSSIQRASFGVNMLGYRIWPTHKRLRKRSVVKFRRDIKILAKLKSKGKVSDYEIDSRIASWKAHASWADTYRMQEVFDQQLETIRG